MDVLDQELMPAVDPPGSLEIGLLVLKHVLRKLVRDERCCGWMIAVFVPELDASGGSAALLNSLVDDVLGGLER